MMSKSKSGLPHSAFDGVNYSTRWYPRGIQILVSTYVLDQYQIVCGGGEGGKGPDQLNPKCQYECKSRSTQPKVPKVAKVPRSSAFPRGAGSEGMMVQTNIPEILDLGHLRNFELKFWKPSLPLHHR